MTSSPRAHRWFVAAAVAGVVHALPSLYWALGGTALASTLGGWAVRWQRESPLQVLVLLLVIFVVKLAGAALPLVNERGGLPAPRLWRGLSWAVAGGLVAYGAVNVVAALAAITGVVEPGPTMDTAALMGHAFLWDPLFLLWGLLLARGLWMSRHEKTAGGQDGEIRTRLSLRTRRTPSPAQPRAGGTVPAIRALHLPDRDGRPPRKRQGRSPRDSGAARSGLDPDP